MLFKLTVEYVCDKEVLVEADTPEEAEDKYFDGDIEEVLDEGNESGVGDLVLSIEPYKEDE